MTRTGIFSAAGLALTVPLLLLQPQGRTSDVVVDEGCPLTSTPRDHRGTTLGEFASAGDGGVIYDGTAQQLQLKKAGGVFQPTHLPVTDTFNIAAVANFDLEGCDDLVVGSGDNYFIRFYKNYTCKEPEPDWSDPSDIRPPKFERTVDIRSAYTATGGHAGIAAGDFNLDGKPDFFYYRTENDHDYLHVQRIYLGNGDGTFPTHYDAVDDGRDLGFIMNTTTSSTVADWNGDGWPDIILGTKLHTWDSSAAVLVLVNDCPDAATTPPTACSVQPTFRVQPLLTNQNFGRDGAGSIAYTDFTGDGVPDLVVGAPTCCSSYDQRMRLWPGLEGGGLASSPQAIGAVGAAAVVLAADFSLDGHSDLVYGTDDFSFGTHLGGQSFFYRSDGDSEPFSAGVTQQLTYHQPHYAGNLFDFDMGVVIDYDGDPDHTPDFIIADGNHSGTFFVFANRIETDYVDCGDVSSGVLDLGDLSDEEMVVTAARLTPDMNLPYGTSVTFYMTNQDPPNWQEAAPCPDDAGSYCVSFPQPSGRSVRWKANLCSNAPDHDRTPSISGVEIAFDYTPAKEHYRAGVVVDNGVAYLGAFSQPGDRGHFYAANAGLTHTYWDAAVKLDAMADSERHIYTASRTGATRLDFTVANAGNTRLQETLGAGSATQAEEIIAWQRSARFGVGNDGIARSRLGAVVASTPAVVTAPPLPVWFGFATQTAREKMLDFMSEHQSRPALVLFGSKDGALHAIRTDPAQMANPQEGTEAWAYIPPEVAFQFGADRAADRATAYPDGSPTIADVKLSDGEFHTVAIVGDGNGGSGVFAIDITETIDEETQEVLGPTPLWHTTAGGALAGQAMSKPVVARVLVDDKETYVAIFGSGVAADDPTAPYDKGRIIVAIDIATGARQWQFEAKCAVTSDILAFETDDEAEPGDPDIDGYVDRIVFADACGYIYKLDPSFSGNWNTSVYGSIATGATDSGGNAINALFSTVATPAALGESRPITGTIGARPDQSGRMILFFGTGGMESYDPSKRNEFYAVYADTGEIRDKIIGECSGGRCEKFYGGVVVTPEQVILTRAIDPPVGTATCDLGSSRVEGYQLNTLVADFSVDIGSATVSPLFGHGGAVYLTTLGGGVIRVGTPASPEAGGEEPEESNPGTTEELTVMGWRQVEE